MTKLVTLRNPADGFLAEVPDSAHSDSLLAKLRRLGWEEVSDTVRVTEEEKVTDTDETA
jgi:hypothetical protein